MKVHLRKKKISNGMMSLYLDYFPPVKTSDGKLTRREFLKKYVYEKPKSKEEKQFNSETLIFAEGIKLERERQLMFEENNVISKYDNNMNFIDLIQNIADESNRSSGDYGAWKGCIKYVKECFGDNLRMGDLSDHNCTKFREFLLSTNRIGIKQKLKLKNNTAATYFIKFRIAVKKAHSSNLIKNDPLIHVKSIKEIETKREFLTQEELQLLAKTEIESELVKKAVLFSVLTGLSWSDIKTLKWGDIQKTNDGYFIHDFRNKTLNVNVHEINQKSVDILGEKGMPNEVIFLNLNYHYCKRKLEEWLLNAGIYKKITFHNLRHTYATLLLNNGVDIYTVSKMLNHTSLKSTMVYAKVLSETKRKACNLIQIEI